MKSKAFTLIELICVIAILSIMAAFLVPRYNQTQKTAIIKQEDAVITALKEATIHEHMNNVTNGNNVWPTACPFTLLSNPPPYQILVDWATFDFNSNNNVHWRALPRPTTYFEWVIFCPHYNGNTNAAPPPAPDIARGRAYLYIYQSGGPRDVPPGTAPAGTWQFPRNWPH